MIELLRANKALFPNDNLHQVPVPLVQLLSLLDGDTLYLGRVFGNVCSCFPCSLSCIEFPVQVD